MHITCPECRATLEPDEIDRDRRECPLCSASLAHLDLSAIEDQLGSEDESIAGNPLPVDADHGSNNSLATAGDQVEIIERSSNRLVAHIPPSVKGSGGLGFFVLVWNGFMVVFTTVAFFVFSKQKNVHVEIIPIVFVSVFWLVGIGLAISWVKLRYTRLYLLLERDRLVLQRKLFRTTNVELPLGPESRASLEQSYAVNDVPVYTVSMQGVGRKESFGTGLTQPDKELLAREINRFLGIEASSLIASSNDSVCFACGAIVPQRIAASQADRVLCPTCQLKAQQTGTQSLWPPLRANSTEELPAGLIVDEAEPGLVLITLPLTPPSKFRTLVSGMVTLFALMWTGGVIVFLVTAVRKAVGFDQVSTILFGIVFLVPAVFIASLAQAFARGQIKISLTRDLVHMSWGWGPIAIRKQFLPEAITACGMLSSKSNMEATNHGRAVNASPVPFPALQAGGTPYPLVTFHGAAYGQKVIRLVRTYLEQVTGRALPD